MYIYTTNTINNWLNIEISDIAKHLSLPLYIYIYTSVYRRERLMMTHRPFACISFFVRSFCKEKRWGKIEQNQQANSQQHFRHMLQKIKEIAKKTLDKDVQRKSDQMKYSRVCRSCFKLQAWSHCDTTTCPAMHATFWSMRIPGAHWQTVGSLGSQNLFDLSIVVGGSLWPVFFLVVDVKKNISDLSPATFH